MFLGALLDAGVQLAELTDFLEPLGIPGLELSAERVMKSGIEATLLKVQVDEGHGHSHDHHHGRTLADICSYLAKQDLPSDLRKSAESVFARIAEAESVVHGKPIEELHFHEVGQWDAIVDVLGVLWLLRRLDIRQVFCSTVNVGGGFVEFSHGKYPVPAPATAHILKSAGIPFYLTPNAGELLTPTGAALLAETVQAFSTPPTMTAKTIAYGAGSRQEGTIPNVVRLIVYENANATSDQVVLLETNIDDMNPEFFEYVFERLFTEGALDVFVTPVMMKKSRPGSQLTVISPVGSEEALAAILFEETTTFGVRWKRMNRWILHRETKTVDTCYGAVRVKIGSGLAEKSVPEYEDCAKAAREHKVPVQEVYRAAQLACEDK